MTLQQIAERAGVSTPTISKVLNGRPDVAPATRERVLQVLHEQQYLPRGASALPSVNKHVELVFDALKNPNNLEILREIVKAAGEHGGHVAVSTVPENMNARRWIHELERVGRAGVIMVTSRLTPEQQRRLQEAALPLVLIDPINSVDGPVPSVGATNWRGGVSAVQHLLELGHRRIAMLRGYECLVDDARYHGYAAAISEAGIALDPSLVERADFRFQPAVSAAERILRLPERPTGMFAANDLEALGVLEAA
ncbi:MAG: LacI family DNA-binding transcriptional regulator, partial [Propionibacteriaceae bacterium]